MPRAAFSQIVNRSMSEVMTRSLATSFCTLLAVVSLLIFGGATLQDFAFAMLIGILSGTYSSIFIASPVLNAWKEREPGFIRRRLRIADENGGLVPSFADEIAVAKLSDDGEPEADAVTGPELPGAPAAESESAPAAEPDAGAVATAARERDGDAGDPEENGDGDQASSERRARDEARRARRQARRKHGRSR
jgi:SecD/SecF fusion protein